MVIFVGGAICSEGERVVPWRGGIGKSCAVASARFVGGGLPLSSGASQPFNFSLTHQENS